MPRPGRSPHSSAAPPARSRRSSRSPEPRRPRPFRRRSRRNSASPRPTRPGTRRAGRSPSSATRSCRSSTPSACIAADVATLSRTEIGELAEGSGGGSSAMPQKRNPAASVLIRSAALRAPQLGATLHLASALAVDERPDGAWHAEWPTLASCCASPAASAAHGAALARGLQVDDAAVARNLALTRGLIVAERLSIVLGPRARQGCRRRAGRGGRRRAQTSARSSRPRSKARARDHRRRRAARSRPVHRARRPARRPDDRARAHPERGSVTVPPIALTAPQGPAGAPLLVLGRSLGTSADPVGERRAAPRRGVPGGDPRPARARPRRPPRRSRSRSARSRTPSPARSTGSARPTCGTRASRSAAPWGSNCCCGIPDS